MKRIKSGLVLLTLLAAPFVATTVKAQGDLLLTPRRIIFDGNKRTQEVNLANTGKDTATYLVSVVEIRMLEDGSFEEILQPDANQNFASKYLRFFPRTVKLGPNEAQSVKIQLTKAGELAAGEYRSHIYFRPLKNAAPLGEEQKPADPKDISVKIVPVVGLSIPVIIRVGDYDAGVSISDVALDTEGEKPTLKMTFNRSGNMSVYGDVVVDHVTPDGKTSQVGLIKGIAVYTPNERRQLLMQLDKKISGSNGKLHITYRPQPEDKVSKLKPVFAETDHKLN